MKEVVNRCLQNAEGINNQIKCTDIPLKSDTNESDTKYDWIKPLVIVTIIGTIFMIGIFFALIAYFEANRPNMQPKYTWPHDITDNDDL